MITEIEIQNYKSILNAKIKLSPFTLLIGANGAGKSNLLQLLKSISLTNRGVKSYQKHSNHLNKNQLFIIIDDKGNRLQIPPSPSENQIRKIKELTNVLIFSLQPSMAGHAESLEGNPIVNEAGNGVITVLDSLKTGDREDLFNLIEQRLKEFIPEIEKLSFMPGQQSKRLQVREKTFKSPIPVSDLSEGTKLAIIILTILHQVNKPSLICLEEIDRSLHPWLYGKIINLCMEMSKVEGMPQIIATTHNPYIVDQFKGHEDAVVIVEKKEGETKFETLAERLKKYENTEDDPLGELWYGGYIGGIPEGL